MTSKAFVAYVPSFLFDEPALLISVDGESIQWLVDGFARISGRLKEAAMVIGDGKPIVSVAGCVLTVRPSDQERGTGLVRVGNNNFEWFVSSQSAEHFRKLLTGLLKSEVSAHQYLDSDERDSPVVLVSKDEYGIDDIRKRLESAS